MSVPDYFDALTAYRAFHAYDTGLLCGQAYNEPWPPYRPMQARCALLAHTTAHLDGDEWIPAPAWSCGCGLHALKSEGAAEARWQASMVDIGQSFAGRAVTAWGTVKLWGRVIEHTDGYRAEYGYPAALYCSDAAIAARIAALYGIPCTVKAQPTIDADAGHFNQYWMSTAGSYTTYTVPVQFTQQYAQGSWTTVAIDPTAGKQKALQKQRAIDQRKFMAQLSGTWTNP